MSTEIPQGLTELLEEFAIAVLREKPGDLIAYAAQYFNTRLAARPGGEQGGKAGDEEGGMETDKPVVSVAGENMDVGNEDSDEEDIPSSAYRNNMAFRRKSVFAEAYDEDDEEEQVKVVHPKSDEQRQRLVSAVRKIFLFRALDQEQLKEVLDAMFEKKVVANETVIEQGQDGDNFYVIDHGLYDCYQAKNDDKAKLVFQYSNEGFFGELALMYNTPRAATIVATTPGSLWGLDRRTFKRIMCDTTSKKRATYQSFLESVPMLKSLEPYELLNLADALERQYYNDGDCVIKEGDAPGSFFIVEDGTVEITRQDTSGQHVFLNSCTRGQYFGELALLTNRPRAASVHARGDVTLAVLDIGAFERLLGPCKEVMKRNFQHYEEQLMELFGTTLDISDAR